MKIVVAPDSFKGSLKSPDVARAMAAGARAAAPDAEIVQLPVGDGGEGTLDALVAATGGTYEAIRVRGPLGAPVEARLGLLGDGETVFVEMAEASGLSLVSAAERDALRASTFGTGELIAAALQTGRKHLLIGIGGSATNDGGAGALQALGVRFLDKAGEELPPGGASLERLATIDRSAFQFPPGVEVIVACDVTNPLTGPEGASAIYGPQKSASAEQITTLDRALAHYASVTSAILGKDWKDAAGAGAAGGLGFALLAFLGARLERGVGLVLDAVRFSDQLAGADLVLTGEGRIDRQTTAYGKTLTGIGERAQRAGVPVLALAGAVSADLGDYRRAGISGLGSVVSRPMSLEDAMRDGAALVEEATRRMVEVFLSGRRSADGAR
ncbi:MAG: Glycerate kinase [Armatimonadetes bacterium]|jgi:glycerate kinase|nr:Glycerate kinase [Armatimonadota bacterium]